MLDKESFDFRTEQKRTVSLISPFDRDSGEILEFPKVGKFHNMELRMTEKSTHVRGSLHKMLNISNEIGEHNYNNLTLCDNYDALDLIVERLYIRPEETKITNLEFGLNIPLGYDPEIFIENSFMWDFVAPTINEKFGNTGNYKEFKKTDFSLKIYNKSKQFKRKENILRIEIKIVKKRKLEELGIYSILDLYESETYRRLFELLLQQFNKIFMIDRLAMRKALKTEEISILKDYSNPHYWENLKKELSTNAYYKRKRKCNEYIYKFSIDKSKKTVRDLLTQQFYDNLDCNSYDLAA
jgi:hypothetical protein